MTEDARIEKLLHAYEADRQDERAYWSTAATILLTALTVLLTVTLVARSVPWGLWIAVPFAAFALGAYHVQQSAIGARRRWYMEAMEKELSREEDALVVDKGNTPVRLFANNRYTWSLASNTEAADKWAIAIFVANVLGPALLIAGVVAISIFRIADSGHTGVAWGIGVPVVVLLVLLLYSMYELTTDDSRDKSWKLAPPCPPDDDGHTEGASGEQETQP